MQDPFRPDLLQGKTTLITGGGSGLGRAMALRLAGLGARVGVIGRRPDPLAETVKLVRDAGGTAAAPPGGGQPTATGQDHDDLGEVASRDGVRLSDLADRGRLGAAFARRAIHQDTQAVIGPLGQSHRFAVLLGIQAVLA